MENLAIEIKNLAFSYTEDPVLKDINLELKSKESMAIFGSNGSGKSTLMRLILGELKAKENEIFIFGTCVTKKKDWKDVAYVPQANVTKSISFPVTCEEILASSQYEKMGLFKIADKKIYKRANEELEKFGLSKYRKVPFNELSGGLQQRVMIARAMLSNPKLLILDEPTAGVDDESKREFLRLLNDLKKESSLSYILVTHEKELVNEVLDIDKSLELKNGRLVNV